MAAKELSVAERLKAMYELQQVDSELDQIQILKGELPMEVSDLEDEIAGLETRVNKLRFQLEDMDGEMRRHDTNIKEADLHIQRYSKQLDNVKNNREYEALVKEIENQKLEIQLSQKRIRESQAQFSGKEETLIATEARLNQKLRDVEQKRVELANIIEKTEKEEEKLKKRSDKARKKIEDRYLIAYDKIRTSYRNGLAVVTVDRNACGGCFNRIPPQLQLEIGLRKKVMVCEHCGRVLVDRDILNADVEANLVATPVAVVAE
jgi:uncharacterized protein